MQRQSLRRYLRSAVAAVVITILTAALAASASAAENSYTVTNLVSDVPGLAAHVDPDLVNGWGLTSLPTSPWWVADNGTDVSTLYRADGTKVPLTVQVPSAPTGAVSNTGPNFVVSNGTASGPALFIFATEEGKVLGLNPNVSLSQAQVAVDHSDIGAVYKGLAIASTPGGDFLYATDFHNGFVDLFDTSGTFLRRVATHGQLNSPWGVAMAPASFGAFGGDLLVGNFGDGQISAFAPQSDGTFELVGQLRTSDHKFVTIDGLWSLQFGKGAANNGPPTTLFFTAGPDDETHGLFGTITAG